MRFRKFVEQFRVYLRDLRASVAFGADTPSRLQLVRDFTLSRFISLVPRSQRGRIREARFRDGITIRYRLNKGDLHSIREIWFEEDYYLPFQRSPGVLLDLGANIGMASIWLAKRFSFTEVIAVEPDPANAALVRENLALNGINGQVVEAAIGPREGAARFKISELSNLGQLSDNGLPVQMVTVDGIIERFAVESFALVKVDIEGGEEALFDGPAAWLERTKAIIMELHPEFVDCGRITDFIQSRGFHFIPAHTQIPDNLPCFTKYE